MELTDEAVAKRRRGTLIIVLLARAIRSNNGSKLERICDFVGRTEKLLKGQMQSP